MLVVCEIAPVRVCVSGYSVEDLEAYNRTVKLPLDVFESSRLAERRVQGLTAHVCVVTTVTHLSVDALYMLLRTRIYL